MLKKNSQCHTPYPRYDSQGRHLDSLPDIITPRADHACATFVSSRGEQVGFQKLTIFYLMTIEKGFPDHGRCRQQWRAIEHRVVLAVKEAVDQRRRSSQAFHQNLINNHYHFDDDQIIIAQMLVISSTYSIAYCSSLTVS